MKRNGFIATSILYSIFLVFLTLFLALILTYLHNQILLQKVNENAWENLMKINNTKISDLKVGDYVQFMDDPVIGEHSDPNDPEFDINQATESVLNQSAKWIVADIEESGNNKIYYFISDIDAAKYDIFFKVSADKIRKYHTLSIDMINEMINMKDNSNENLYQQSIQFKNYDLFEMGFPTSTKLAKIRNDNIEDEVKNLIFGVDASYIIKIDADSGKYKNNTYYNYRMYNFTLDNSKKGNIINTYCNGTYSSGKVTYGSDNTFGYINKVWDTASNDEYIDYCSYASPVPYSHNVKDKVVDTNETMDSDIASLTGSAYNFRLMLKLGVDSNRSDTYVSGGSGLKSNPYIIMDGVKKE